MSRSVIPLVLLASAAACTSAEKPSAQPEEAAPVGAVITVHAAPIEAPLEAAGVATPFAEATLSTKLMGTVTAVRVHEGDRVRAGDVMVTIDARDLAARGGQAAAGLAEAEAMAHEAATHADRMRTLFAEEAAPRAQLDAAETALARAQAAVSAARAGAAEVGATRDYAAVRAPFDGVVIRRWVDPGAFATPGSPLVAVQDDRRLRVRVTAAPDAIRGLARGARIAARIEDVPAEAVVEGVVPAGGNLYAVNALVDNAAGTHLAGSAATLAIPRGSRLALLVPAVAVRRQGDLTGVLVRSGATTELRWVQLGRTLGDRVEVLAGLQDGEQILVPTALAGPVTP